MIPKVVLAVFKRPSRPQMEPLKGKFNTTLETALQEGWYFEDARLFVKLWCIIIIYQHSTNA